MTCTICNKQGHISSACRTSTTTPPHHCITVSLYHHTQSRPQQRRLRGLLSHATPAEESDTSQESAESSLRLLSTPHSKALATLGISYFPISSFSYVISSSQRRSGPLCERVPSLAIRREERAVPHEERATRAPRTAARTDRASSTTSTANTSKHHKHHHRSVLQMPNGWSPRQVHYNFLPSLILFSSTFFPLSETAPPMQQSLPHQKLAPLAERLDILQSLFHFYSIFIFTFM